MSSAPHKRIKIEESIDLNPADTLPLKLEDDIVEVTDVQIKPEQSTDAPIDTKEVSKSIIIKFAKHAYKSLTCPKSISYTVFENDQEVYSKQKIYKYDSIGICVLKHMTHALKYCVRKKYDDVTVLTVDEILINTFKRNLKTFWGERLLKARKKLYGYSETIKKFKVSWVLNNVIEDELAKAKSYYDSLESTLRDNSNLYYKMT